MSEDIHLSLSQDLENGYWPKIAYALGLTIAIAFGISFYRFSDYLPSQLDYLLLLAMASLVILIGMAGLYVYASRFYNDSFYLFIALGWIANAFYLFFEAFFPRLWSDLNFSFNVSSL